MTSPWEGRGWAAQSPREERPRELEGAAQGPRERGEGAGNEKDREEEPQVEQRSFSPRPRPDAPCGWG